MPHVAIHLYPGRERKVKQEIADKAVDFCKDTLGFPEESISVSIVETPADEFSEKVSARYNKDELYVSSDFIK